MAAVGYRNYIELNKDETIYRTFSECWFVDLLRTGKNGLRSPSTWDDPFENFFMSATTVAFGEDLISLDNLAEDWYGQCWSLNSDTDAMWRIYSARKDGIQVKTTVSKLLDSLQQLNVFSPSIQFFVGRVEYRTQAAIQSLMSGLTFADIVRGGQNDGFARLLCLKREAFAHENEVRLLYADLANQPGGKKGIGQTVHHPLDANAVFDEILLDPRLTDSAASAMAARLAAAGWHGPAPKSTLYEAPAFTIRDA